MALKSNLKSDSRVREAATVPFMSMQLGKDKGKFAVTLVQTALKQIQLNSYYLPTKLRPRAKGDDGNQRWFHWGPFEIAEDERQERVYGGDTHTAVCKFQRQDGLLIDGKAGMITLQRIDEILSYVENTPPPAPAG